jgi:exodeoxyribonuclease VII large subunit
MAPTKALCVSEITAILKDRLEDLPPFTVEGEVSNLHPANASGHLYFSLIDATAKLNVAFFAFRQKAQGNVPAFKNGDKIRATGRISVYAPHGSYHLNVERVELCDGTGDLLMRFEKLKRQLYAEGLCDPARKRTLPLLPKRVGIVTAPTGAAIRDILNILGRRFPNLHIVVAPCRVQGPEAAGEITAAIQLLNRHFAPNSAEPMDAMIVGRGGGSLEELWCFNEECVARAVAASKIPVISAVGHEPDIAMTDFVADLRAPTPSAAAELLCGKKEDIERHLSEKKERLIKAMRVSYIEARNYVHQRESSALFRDPLHLLERHAQSTDAREDRLKFALENRLAHTKQHLFQQHYALESHGSALFLRAREHLSDATHRLEDALNRVEKKATAQLIQQTATLKALDPRAVLTRGYAFITHEKGHVITDATQAQTGDTLHIHFAQNALTATVTPPQATEPTKTTK